MDSKINTQDTILYLISRLGNSIEGRKKLMKMMFLVEHFNFQSNKISKQKNLGNDFIIYHYGVFSFDVMNSFLELSQNGKISLDMPLKVLTGNTMNLTNQPLKQRVDCIIDLFGKKSGKELELETLKMLNLNLETKRNHFGESVIQLIN